MTERTIDGFFYGLFMDPAVLDSYGIPTRNPRSAYVENFELLIGNRATLWPLNGSRAFGMIYSMTNHELESLYSGSGLKAYKPEALTAVTLGNEISFGCLCYNLTTRPAIDELNNEYAEKLVLALRQFDFPNDYIDSIGKKRNTSI